MSSSSGKHYGYNIIKIPKSVQRQIDKAKKIKNRATIEENLIKRRGGNTSVCHLLILS